MKKIIALVLSALVIMSCVFAFAACGNKTGNETTDASTDAASDASTEATEATEAPELVEDLAAITDAGKLVVGITEYAPMDFKAEDGSWTGFDAEYATLVAEKLGVEVEFIEIDWDNKVFELNDKKVDCIWNGMTITDALKESMDITDPYVKNAQVVVMKADAAADYAEDKLASEYTIAVEAGSAADFLAQDSEYENITALSVQSDALLEVESGKADVAIIDKTMAEAMTGEGTSYADLTVAAVLNDEVYGVGCRKGSDLCTKINEITAELSEDGTLKTLAEKYGLALAD